MSAWIKIALLWVPLWLAPPLFAQDSHFTTHQTTYDMSALGMYHAAHPVVKGVMLVLVGASILTWAIFLLKWLQLRLAIIVLNKEQQRLKAQPTLQSIAQHIPQLGQHSVTTQLFQEIADELNRSEGQADHAFVERIDYRLERQIQHWTYRRRYGIGMLATIGSVAPFIGLFGTVWGIMNSFIGIVNAKTTNLAVVAPGIAEALFATALGLVAAIPAVMMYNYFTRLLAHYATLVGNLAAMLRLMVKRDISLQRLSTEAE